MGTALAGGGVGGRRVLPSALERPVRQWTGNVEEFAELGGGVLAGPLQGGKVGHLARRELGLLAPRAALGVGDLFIPARVRAEIRSASNSATIASTLTPAARPDRSGHAAAAQIQLDLATGEVFDDVARVGQRAREPVELRDDDRVAGAAGAERFAQPRAVPVGAGQPVIDVDALVRAAKVGQALR